MFKDTAIVTMVLECECGEFAVSQLSVWKVNSKL